MFKWGDSDSTIVQRLSDGKYFHESEEAVVDFLSSGGIIEPYWTKEMAHLHMTQEIEDYANSKVDNSTVYVESLGHNMYLDLDFTLKVAVSDINKTYQWKTADKEADGVTPIWVTLDKSQLKDLYEVFLDYGEQLFQLREYHKGNLIGLYKDPEATADIILNYDYTTGWEI